MKKHIVFPYLFIFSLLISFTACKKDSKSKDNTDIATHSDDQSRFSSEIDALSNDADVAVEADPTLSGRFQGVQGIDVCDATVVANLNSNPRTLTITYNGTNCQGNRTRTGVVIVSMAQGVQWKNAGAVITVTIQNLKITRLSDNKSITINGTQTYTNVNGGLLVNLVALGNITHDVASSGLSVTFDNGSQRNWQVAKRRVFTYNNGIVITGTGRHADGTNTGIAEWGTNRFGAAFATSIVEPLVVRQDCSFRLTSGKVKHTTPSVTATVTFGLNANGDATACPGLGNYYFKVIWVGPNGGSITIIWPY